MNSFSTVSSQISSLTGVSLDLLILGIFALLVFGYTFYFGRQKGAALIISFYPAVLLYSSFPYLKNFLFWRGNASQVAWSRLIVFALFIALVNVALARFIRSGYSSSTSMFSAVAISGIATALLLVTLYAIVPFAAVHDFSPLIDKLFAFESALFWWFAGSLAALFLVRKN